MPGLMHHIPQLINDLKQTIAGISRYVTRNVTIDSFMHLIKLTNFNI
ncbi:hypothetical protein KSZ_35750 [Dictyobacter formicarum]|uniref:Uncharacterized protein n=1 Tax=Dictyobacter formicarum TaxID=2778368 RepID=A0ABQ3VIQ2_9CHLR|nr:hypothetical protein KSZ_35750 [Dictyobacter formicarum]